VGHIRDFAGCADAECATATDDHEIDNQAPLRDPAPGDAGLFQFDQSGPGVIVSTIRASDLDHCGISLVHFRVLDGSAVARLLLCYFETLTQESCSSIRSLAI
jgi:hypothetical protein